MANLISILLSIFLTTLFSWSAFGQRVIDGDTIELRNLKIRLQGVDAPELNQRCQTSDGFLYDCGQKSAEKLKNLLERTNDKVLKCKFLGEDIYGRIIADCFLGEIEINSWLVRNGLALAYRKYSRRYVSDERFAERNSLGIWNGHHIKPWNWRRGDRLDVELEQVKTVCKIKGNISSTGKKIYHLENSQHYSNTKISINKGEKWFCSEQAAIEAGWRKAKQ